LAPTLHDVIRQVLEEKGVPGETIKKYLADRKSLGRYNTAFRKLWTLMLRGVDPWRCSIEKIASFIIEMTRVSAPEARNAYAGVVMIPGFDQLKFCALLQPYKRDWNISIPKYSRFWEPKVLIKKLVKKKLNFSSVEEVRDRLILVFMLFHLTRSIDLARCYRVLSMQDGKPFVLFQRKGQRVTQWEQVYGPGPPTID